MKKRGFVSIQLVFLLLVAASTGLWANGNKEKDMDDGQVNLTYLAVEAVFIEDYATNDFTMFMQDKTGVHIDWETIPEQALEEKLNLVLASGDYPDVFFGLGLNDDKLSLYGGGEGLLMPLNEYVHGGSMPYLNEVLDQVPGSRGAITSPDGNIYGLPSFNICYHCINSQKTWVYQPWLDALGLDMPQTTAEFKAMLMAFRDGDPNGNGEKDEIPYAGAIKGWHNTAEMFLLNSFVYTDIDSRIDIAADRYIGFYLDDGMVQSVVDTPEYRDALRYLNDLYEEGLIFPGSFTQDSPQLVQLVEGSDLPTVGVTTGGWGGMFSNFGGDRYRNYRAIPPLEGPDGVRNTPTFLAEPSPGHFVIASTCPHPDAAIEWADFLYSVEGTMRSRNGLENVGWRWAEDGEMGIDGQPAIWTQLRPWNDKDPQNECYMENGPVALTSAVRLGQSTDNSVDLYGQEGLELMLYQATRDLYRPYADDSKALPRLKYLTDEISEYSTMRVEYAKFVKQSLVQFIVGDLDVESDWDSYVSNLRRLGHSDLMALTQTAYDRQFK